MRVLLLTWSFLATSDLESEKDPVPYQSYTEIKTNETLR